MFRKCFFSPLSSFKDGKLKYKYHDKRIITCDNDNVQSHDQEEIKLNSTIIVNSSAHTLTDD